MMAKIKKYDQQLLFYKMQASGNDFILIDCLKEPKSKSVYSRLALTLCQRKFSVGADGLLVMEKDKKTKFRMRIFNADGSEAEMCGNGARCAAFWLWRKEKIKDKKEFHTQFNTLAGDIYAKVTPLKNNEFSGRVKIKMVDPTAAVFNRPIKIMGEDYLVCSINTGVPHGIIFVQDFSKLEIEKIGRQIRWAKEFSPAGTNVNFVKIIGKDKLKVRTYERGVEAETLACGTGVTASALIYFLSRVEKKEGKHRIEVEVNSGEVLRVYFKYFNGEVKDVWLEGMAHLVFIGNKKGK